MPLNDQDDRFKLIKAGLLIDGLDGPPVKRGAVLFRDSKIIAAGPEGEVAPPEGAPVEVLDYSDKTVMPGMVDCHTHHNGFGDGRLGDDLARLPDEVLTLQSARNARASLFSGVTTIRENGSKNATTIMLREAIRQGITVGPRMVLCGRPLTITGGHMWYFGSEVNGPVEARAVTRQVIKEGADYIKISATGGSTLTSFPLRPAFNVNELRAITDEAHKFGKLTAAHCLSTQGTANCLDAGVDMIIHCVFKEPDDTDNFREDVAERLAKQSPHINPTLHVFRARVWSLEYKKEREGLSAEEEKQLGQFRRDFETRIEDCNRLINMGLKVVTGSDSSWGDYQLGNTVYEAECLTMAGYSPMQAVLSVTSRSAVSLGVDSVTGTLEPGKEADIVALDGNPAKNINALWNVADVFLAGRRIDRGSAESIAALRQLPPGGH